MAAMTAMIDGNFEGMMSSIDAPGFDYSNDIRFGGQVPRIVGAVGAVSLHKSTRDRNCLCKRAKDKNWKLFRTSFRRT